MRHVYHELDEPTPWQMVSSRAPATGLSGNVELHGSLGPDARYHPGLVRAAECWCGAWWWT